MAADALQAALLRCVGPGRCGAGAAPQESRIHCIHYIRRSAASVVSETHATQSHFAQDPCDGALRCTTQAPIGTRATARVSSMTEQNEFKGLTAPEEHEVQRGLASPRAKSLQGAPPACVGRARTGMEAAARASRIHCMTHLKAAEASPAPQGHGAQSRFPQDPCHGARSHLKNCSWLPTSARHGTLSSCTFCKHSRLSGGTPTAAGCRCAPARRRRRRLHCRPQLCTHFCATSSDCQAGDAP